MIKIWWIVQCVNFESGVNPLMTPKKGVGLVNFQKDYLYVEDGRTSGPFFWNFWEHPRYFGLNYLL